MVGKAGQRGSQLDRPKATGTGIAGCRCHLLRTAWPSPGGPFLFTKISFSPQRFLLQFGCMCDMIRTYMRHQETANEVRRWFREAVKDLWPIAAGSLSLRKSPCIRERCSRFESGDGNLSYVLYGRRGKRRFCLY